MAQGQHPSDLEESGEQDFSSGENVLHDNNAGGAALDAERRRGWDAETAPDDDFGDHDAQVTMTGDAEGDELPPKRRGGMLGVLLIVLLLLGGGGFAFWQFIMKSGDSASGREPVLASAEPVVPVPLADASAPQPPTSGPAAAALPGNGSAQLAQEPVSLPTPVPPPGLVDAAAASAGAREAVVAQGSLAHDVQLSSSGQAVPNALPPPVLPAPPMPGGTASATGSVSEGSVAGALASSSLPPTGLLPGHAAQPTMEPGGAVVSSPQAADELRHEVRSLQDKVNALTAAAADQEKSLAEARAALAAQSSRAEELDTEKKALEARLAAGAKAGKRTANIGGAGKAAKRAATAKALGAKHKKPMATVQASAWVLRSVAAGAAWIAPSSSSPELKEVRVGDVIPGLGRIKSIAVRGGHWEVQGTVRSLK